ncbi:MAG: hypothetical protein AB7K52_15045 [Phycisphaerales bacterium]
MLFRAMLAGSVGTLLVAWSLAVLSSDPFPLVANAVRRWPVTPPSAWPPPEHVARARRAGVELTEASAVPDLPGLAPNDASPVQRVLSLPFQRVRAFGWPLPCLESRELDGPGAWQAWRSAGAPPAFDLNQGLACPEWFTRALGTRPDARLPIVVRPFAFAADAVLFAAACLPLTGAVNLLRRASRCRRGLCPACAYPRGPSPACSECGEPLHAPPDLTART